MEKTICKTRESAFCSLKPFSFTIKPDKNPYNASHGKTVGLGPCRGQFG